MAHRMLFNVNWLFLVNLQLTFITAPFASQVFITSALFSPLHLYKLFLFNCESETEMKVMVAACIFCNETHIYFSSCYIPPYGLVYTRPKHHMNYFHACTKISLVQQVSISLNLSSVKVQVPQISTVIVNIQLPVSAKQ